MSEIFICTCKIKESGSPYIVSVYADSYSEAEQLFRMCAKSDGYKIIKNSVFCQALEELLGCGIQKMVPKPIDLNFEDADLNDKL